MIKMVKEVNGILEYWEIWFNDASKEFFIHYGKVGDTGHHYTKKKRFGQNTEKYMSKIAEEQIEKGFAYLDEESLIQVVIQFKTNGEEEVHEDLDLRYKVEGLMNECLGWTGNGYCDGGDYGSGTMNVFCHVVDLTKAVITIVDELKKNNLLNGALIGHMESDEHLTDFPTKGERMDLV